MNKKQVEGMLSLDQLKSKIESGEIETVLTVFPDSYGRLIGKRNAAKFFRDSVIDSGTHMCNYLLTVDMEMDVIEGYNFASWTSGYGDFHGVPDWDSIRIASWMDKSVFVMCDLEMNHKSVEVAPRSMLKNQIKNLADLGYSALTASELEHYVFKDTYETASKKGYQNLEPYGSYIQDYHILQCSREEYLHADVRRHLEASGIPVETSKGEWGPGQHEINVRYSTALDMADRHVFFKECLKEVAISKELSVTFMAKVDSDLAGSSMHVHLSLVDQKGQPVFPGDTDCGNLKTSDEFRWFLGGWMKHAAALTAFYAPNPNSYKRYVSQSWAPTAIAWSHDNRTAGFRIVGEDSPGLRIECRIPGADCNPYLAFAVSLAAGIDGLKNKIEPPPVFTGDVYAASELPKVPGNLRDAIVELEKSDMLKVAFGEVVIDHYLHFFRTELRKYEEAVTTWERARYFERI